MKKKKNDWLSILPSIGEIYYDEYTECIILITPFVFAINKEEKSFPFMIDFIGYSKSDTLKSTFDIPPKLFPLNKEGWLMKGIWDKSIILIGNLN